MSKKKNKILVIGERCIDLFNYVNVERLSPEAPVPIVTISHTTDNFGMAGNVYENLKSLTKSKEIAIDTIFQEGSSPLKIRYVDEKTNHYFLRVDKNDICNRIELNQENRKKIKSADVIVISDYDKGFLLEEDILYIRKLNKVCDIFLDTKKIMSEKIFKIINYLKINEKEYSRNFFSNEIIEKYRKKVIVTQGELGAFYDGVWYSQNNPVKTIDVSGAGDTFMAALVASYISHADIVEAIHYANHISKQVVSQRGVSVAKPN
jgi:bifunctional ADP-heptose synthase (sugar kinase/adenylyltransferase)